MDDANLATDGQRDRTRKSRNASGLFLGSQAAGSSSLAIFEVALIQARCATQFFPY